MVSPFDSITQQLGADHAVGDSVAAVGHGEVHTWSVLLMRTEEWQPILRLREGSGHANAGRSERSGNSSVILLLSFSALRATTASRLSGMSILSSSPPMIRRPAHPTD